jgi:UDP-N-acetylglucosamine 2-epimerase (non-hydrolysing)
VLEPLGFFDWARLERDSRLAITDSGTVQEEMCLFRKPTITIRATTERPETVSCGSNIVSGLDFDNIVMCYQSGFAVEKHGLCPKNTPEPMSATQ